MSSFSCPHFDQADDYCDRVEADCVPGRPGCVLSRNSVFAIPVEQRIQEQAESRRARRYTADAQFFRPQRDAT